jgi:hypothetical protein
MRRVDHDNCNPGIPEFAHFDSYGKFARRVCRERRYATDAASRAFIATVLATAPARLLTIKKEQILYRAQPGVIKKRHEIVGNDRERMVPEPEFVKNDGRANAARIAYPTVPQAS